MAPEIQDMTGAPVALEILDMAGAPVAPEIRDVAGVPVGSGIWDVAGVPMLSSCLDSSKDIVTRKDGLAMLSAVNISGPVIRVISP